MGTKNAEDKIIHFFVTKELGDVVLSIPLKPIQNHPVIIRTLLGTGYFIVWNGCVECLWLHNYGALIADAGSVLTSIDYIETYHKHVVRTKIKKLLKEYPDSAYIKQISNVIKDNPNDSLKDLDLKIKAINPL